MLLILIALPVGGLILLGLSVYIGVLAHRARALAVAHPATLPTSVPGGQPLVAATSTPPPVRKFFGLKPSYRLSAVCAVVGLLMFIGGIALFNNTGTPQSQTASPTHAPAAPAAPPATTPPPATPPPAASRQPVFAAPQEEPKPAPATAARQALPTKNAEPIEGPPAEKAVRPQPAEPQPAAPQPVEPQPAEPQPAAPQPAVPQPVAPQPAAPQPAANDDGGAVYYKNCAEARAAGAAPVHRGQPGYRTELDRDGDGTACDKDRS